MFTSKNNKGRNFGRDLDAEQLRQVCGGTTRDYGAQRDARSSGYDEVAGNPGASIDSTLPSGDVGGTGEILPFEVA